MKAFISIVLLFLSINAYSNNCTSEFGKEPPKSEQDDILEAVKLAHVGQSFRNIEPKMKQLKILSDKIKQIGNQHPDYSSMVQESLEIRKNTEKDYKVILDFFISKNFKENRIRHIFYFENGRFLLNDISKDKFSDQVNIEFVYFEDAFSTRTFSQWQIPFKLLEEILMYYKE